MAYGYCPKCDSLMYYPSNEEIIKGSIKCDCINCGGKLNLDKELFTDLILTLIERIERLEERFK